MNINTVGSTQPIHIDTLTDIHSIHRLREIEDKRQQAEALASNLESIFLSMMVKAMRSTVPESELLGQSYASRQYHQMLDHQLSQTGDLLNRSPLHEALVRQILDEPTRVNQALERLNGPVPVRQPNASVERTDP